MLSLARCPRLALSWRDPHQGVAPMPVGPAGKRRKRSVSRKKRAELFESLETRQLFAVITVTDYGAIANDGKDDSGAIQKALDASKTNDTILFSGGTFDLKTEMKTWPS